MKNGELYVCSFAAIPQELNERLNECKDLLHDFNMSRPSRGDDRAEIIRKVFADLNAALAQYQDKRFEVTGAAVKVGPDMWWHNYLRQGLTNKM